MFAQPVSQLASARTEQPASKIAERPLERVSPRLQDELIHTVSKPSAYHASGQYQQEGAHAS